ncbi:CX domain-containing protein [Meloidogyne graminicola]|uniref:CX domain-containing protein n=1 Tax=Meloidogyne graminicola TaxID=189291 RepID=A0A8S9ZX05_9BILA|nr:CX domain-containing protein [Meloidogyne graminicola]
MTSYNFWRTLFFFILIFTSEILGRRGGGGGGFGRGGGFGSRGSSAARSSSAKSGSGGGLFGGGGRSNTGTGHYSSSGKSGSHGGYYGGTGGGFSHSRYREKGYGSHSRSDMFKNMIVGAAAGYLTYQAGKAIIRSMSTPMMWNNRNYYWGQQYYPGGTSSSRTMCRMPIESGDLKFGNIYTPDGSRPKEIVWSCSYNEECCGYECCPGGYGYGSGHSRPGIGIGYATIIFVTAFFFITIVLIIILCICLVLVIKYFLDKRKNQMDNRTAEENRGEYQRADVNYKTNVQPSEAPPPYPSTGTNGYPVDIGFRYPPA